MALSDSMQNPMRAKRLACLAPVMLGMSVFVALITFRKSIFTRDEVLFHLNHKPEKELTQSHNVSSITSAIDFFNLKDVMFDFFAYQQVSNFINRFCSLFVSSASNLRSIEKTRLVSSVPIF